MNMIDRNPTLDRSAELADGLLEPVRRNSLLGFKSIAFLLISVLPTILFAAYLYWIAADQYVSEFRFTVQHGRPVSAGGSAGGGQLGSLGAESLAAMALVESQTLVQYMKSRQIIDDLSTSVDLRKIYATDRADWWWRLEDGAPKEDLVRYWQRMVDPYFDLTSGIIIVEVRAFSPRESAQVALGIERQAERLINGMSNRARQDAEEYAGKLVSEAESRLRRAELALRDFRNTNTLLTPEMTATISGKLESQLRDEIASTRTKLDVFRLQGVQDTAPRVLVLRDQLASLEQSLVRHRETMTRQGGQLDSNGRPLASTISDYDALDIDLKIATSGYSRALDAQSQARAFAQQQAVYLATFVQPAEPQISVFPRRYRWLFTFFLTSLGAWALLLLLGYSIKDHLES